MKKYIKNIIYRLLAALPSSAILMLHNITDDAKLKKHIFLSNDKFVLMVDSFQNWMPLEKVIERPSIKGISLTFDDGFEDVYLIAYPYLKSKNIPFTVFVTVDKLDTEGYLTTEQLRELSNDPLCTVGAHCYHHLPLAKLSAEDQKMELYESKRVIEEKIGQPVLFMAFPYGSYNKVTLQILKQTKAYKASCIVGRGF